MPTPLGPFLLHHALDEGAMGQVWQGEHAETGTPVAVKVIAGHMADDPRYKASFMAEVQLLARLEHPGIVSVYDYGLLPPEVADATGGALQAQSPYLVMELATFGSIRAVMPFSSWQMLRHFLSNLLRALAFAHARGIVHRDLKPENLLLAPHEVLPYQIKLSDFGLAHRYTAPEGTPKPHAGTPLYMAPEQFQGAWRDFGPWTDLYAVGCLAYEWATGVPPFVANTFLALSIKHTTAPVPAMRPRFAIPEDFEEWVRHLLQKAPNQRFQRAFDAEWALSQLGEPAREPGRGPAATPHAATDTLEEAPADAPQAHSLRVTREPTATIQTFRLPPFPERWEDADDTAAVPRLPDAGLGLVGLRRAPFTRRPVPCDALWAALGRVHRQERPEVVVITGDAGVGKTRLADQVGVLAHERGLAEVVRGTHDAISEPDAGVLGMVESLLSTWGLERDLVHERLGALTSTAAAPLSGRLSQALVELLRPAEVHGQGAAPEVRHANRAERLRVVLKLLERLTAERPAVLLLDDVQWGADSLALCDALLQSTRRVPALVLLTLRPDALVERPMESRLLQELYQRPGCYQLQLPAMSRHETHALVHRLLPMDTELAADLVDRAHGNPGHLLDLLEDLSARGAIVPGPSGFTLEEGVDVELPDSLFDIWNERLFPLLGQMGDVTQALSALEIAAVLGRYVDLNEWVESCRHARLPVAPRLLDPLVERGWIQADRTRWAFTDEVLREVLLRSATESGRLAFAHDACADMLARRLEQGGPTALLERRALHLAGADRPREALDGLLEAIQRHAQRSDYARAAALTDRYDRVLEDADLAPHDERRGLPLALAADIALRRGDLEDAQTRAREAARLGQQHDWPRTKARACLVEGNILMQQGRLRRASHQFETARHVGQVTGAPSLHALALSGMAAVEAAQGSFAAARRHLDAARRLFDEAGDASGLASCKTQLAMLARAEGRYGEAEELLLEALVQADAHDNRFHQAEILNNLGDIHRHRGDLDEAQRRYQEALTLSETHGTSTIHLSRLNIGVVLTARGCFGQAREVVEPLVAFYRDTQQSLWLTCARYLMLPITAGEDDLDAFDEAAEAAEALSARTGAADNDLAEAAQRAGELWLATFRYDRASVAFALAAEQWERLGQPDKVEAVKRRM